MTEDIEKIRKFIASNAENIAKDITACNFSEVASYRSSNITSSESDTATEKFIGYVADYLGKDEDALSEDFLKYTEKVAQKRAMSNIGAFDLIEAIKMTGNVILDWIENKGPKTDSVSVVFAIVKKINAMVDKFSIDVTKKFIERQNLLIENQKNSLKIWDEVVKRTSNLDLKIPCTGEFVLIARAQAKAIAARLNMTQEEIDDFVLVIGEACDNAIEHGVSDQGVDLHYIIMPDEIMVKIKDYGRGFDPTGKGDEIPDLFSERGRGIFLMKTLSTSVNIESEIGKGTTVTIKKQRTSGTESKCA